MADGAALVRMVRIGKRYGGVQACREVDLRLEVKLELPAIDRTAQALLGRELGRGSLEQFRAEEAHAAAALGLGVE